jgi:hypothetical protein
MTALAAFLIYPVDEPTLFGESLNLAEELTTLRLGGEVSDIYVWDASNSANSTLTDALAALPVAENGLR